MPIDIDFLKMRKEGEKAKDQVTTKLDNITSRLRLIRSVVVQERKVKSGKQFVITVPKKVAKAMRIEKGDVVVWVENDNPNSTRFEVFRLDENAIREMPKTELNDEVE